MVEHPAWCDRSRCRADGGGPHTSRSTPIEAEATRVSVYLRQLPDEVVPTVMLSVGHRGVGMAVPLTPDLAERLAERLAHVVTTAVDLPADSIPRQSPDAR